MRAHFPAIMVQLPAAEHDIEAGRIVAASAGSSCRGSSRMRHASRVRYELAADNRQLLVCTPVSNRLSLRLSEGLE